MARAVTGFQQRVFRKTRSGFRNGRHRELRLRQNADLPVGKQLGKLPQFSRVGAGYHDFPFHFITGVEMEQSL